MHISHADFRSSLFTSGQMIFDEVTFYGVFFEKRHPLGVEQTFASMRLLFSAEFVISLIGYENCMKWTATFNAAIG
jgi:hypothetical protein